VLRGPWSLVLILAAALAAPLAGEDFAVYTDHPRLLLPSQRLRLLRRERERASARWQQFESLVKGGARMPERGLASALYHQVSGDPAAGREAIEWALAPDADLRQMALVFDWCQAVASAQQLGALAARIRKGIERSPQGAGVAEARSRALAATALAGYTPEVPERELRRLVEHWWKEDIVAALKGGRNAIPGDDVYALFELLHAVHDNLNLDLRESLPGYFKNLPLERLLSYYPTRYETGTGAYRVPARKGFRSPESPAAESSRAADLAAVAYDANAVETQYLQGWLMHDAFMMRSPAGAPYEFLWANPYQPGLSYYNAPLALHDRLLGRLFLRTSWDDDADWAGYFDGELQLFEKGELKSAGLAVASAPIRLGDAAIIRFAPQFKIDGSQVRQLFLIGLKPRQSYTIDLGGKDKHPLSADSGGILEVPCPSRPDVTVRIAQRR
jgi:hypothetical protein